MTFLIILIMMKKINYSHILQVSKKESYVRFQYLKQKCQCPSIINHCAVQGNRVHNSAIQGIEVHGSAVHYTGVLSSTVNGTSVHHSAVHYSALHNNWQRPALGVRSLITKIQYDHYSSKEVPVIDLGIISLNSKFPKYCIGKMFNFCCSI